MQDHMIESFIPQVPWKYAGTWNKTPASAEKAIVLVWLKFIHWTRAEEIESTGAKMEQGQERGKTSKREKNIIQTRKFSR